MKILVSGLGGHMGEIVGNLAKAGYCQAELLGGVSLDGICNFDVPCAPDFETDTPGFSEAVLQSEVVIDFSHHSCTKALLDFCIKNHLPLVLATTGHTDEEKAAIIKASEQIPLFYAANFSLGIALLIHTAKTVAAAMPDAEIEIIEKHHDRKLDAPSGTALAIAHALQDVRPEATIHSGRDGYGKREKNEIGIHAIRMGNIVGDHEVIIGTKTQTITLKHEAHDRALFAEGALQAAAYLYRQPDGLYDMNSLVSL